MEDFAHLSSYLYKSSVLVSGMLKLIISHVLLIYLGVIVKKNYTGKFLLKQFFLYYLLPNVCEFIKKTVNSDSDQSRLLSI